MEDKSPNKIKVEKVIFAAAKETPFAWKDLKHIQFEDEDKITVAYDEGYYSENNSWDSHYYARVIRMVEETDAQFQKRQKKIEEERERTKKMRYESYLRLKKEFENE